MMATIKELKELDAKATSAPWFISDDRYSENNSRVICANGNNYHSIAEVRNGADDDEYGGKEREQFNAQLIATTRNVLPDLIRVIELAEEAFQNISNQQISANWQDNIAVLNHARIMADKALTEIRKLKGE